MLHGRIISLLAVFVLGGVVALGGLAAAIYVLSLVLVDVPYIHRKSTVLASQQYGTQQGRDFSPVEQRALPTGASVQPAAEGLEEPVALVFLPSGDALITERAGRVRLLRGDGTLAPEPALTIPDTGADKSLELGLLGIDARATPQGGVEVFLYHTVEEDGDVRSSVVERYRWDGARLVDGAVVTEIDFGRDVEAHVAGGVQIGPDGMLYVSVGDIAGLTAGSITAQDLSTPFGAILRMTPEGGIPPDNPYVRHPTADQRIFASGLRNAFDFTFDPATGALWAAETGSAYNDEINRVHGGRNYGWPIAGGWAHELPFALPLVAFEAPTTPTGVVIYHGDMFEEWEGDLLFCSFNFGLLHHVESESLDSETPAPVGAHAEATGCLSDAVVAPDGSIYMLDLFGGRVLRLAR
jgi:glucose/arabinose dehydrogenase